MRLALAALIACSLVGCAGGRGASRVEAEGWAAAGADGAAGARRRALAQALRAAVETAAGVRVSGRTLVRGAVAVEQSLFTRSSGRVEDYKVLSERSDESGARVRVRARVALGERGEPPGPPLPPPGDPSVAVTLEDPGAAAAVAASLLGRGFRLGGATPQIEISAASNLAPQAPAGPVRWPSFRATVSLRAVESATGRVLAECSRDAASADPAAQSARDKALKAAAALAAESLAAELYELLERESAVAAVPER